METADHHVLESVALYLCPVLNLVVRDVLHIAGHVVGSIGVGALASDARHQLVVLVRDVVFGSQLRNRIDFVVSLLALCRVGQLAVALISACDFVEIRLLLGVVDGAELLGSLEHQVLQIVGKTGCLGRVVSGTCLDGDISLQTRFFLVNRHVHRQTVVEGVDAGFHGITWYGGVMIILSCGADAAHQDSCQQNMLNLHF